MSYPILYSFRRCPYAIRARMTLRAMGHICTLREVVLRNKPAAMLQVSPKGTVPVLCLTDGRILEESLEIMAWAVKHQQAGAIHPLQWPQDSESIALIEFNDGPFKHHLDRYKYANRYENTDRATHLAAAQSFLQMLEARLEVQPFLTGESLGLVDVAIGPFVRQFANTDRQWFDDAPYEATRRWLNTFLQSEIFTQVMSKYPPWKEGAPVTMFPDSM